MANNLSSEGFSLWLVPSPSSSLHTTIQHLIHFSIPTAYPAAIPPKFSPHVTLTGGTIHSDVARQSPQKWLDGLDLPTSGLHISIRKVVAGAAFFQKLIMLCDKTKELCELAAYCRDRATGEGHDAVIDWIGSNYRPHCSLMYSDAPEDEIQSNLDEVNAKIAEAMQAHSDAVAAKGAEIWLVATFRDVEDWQPLAVRTLLDVTWSWET